MASKHESFQDKDVTLQEGSGWSNAWKYAAGVGLVGVLGTAAFAFGDPKRFAFSYLYAFCAVLMIALGGLFFVIVQHLVGANWSVTVRRTAEFMASALPVFVLLAVPVFLTFPLTSPMLSHEHTGGEHALLTVFEGSAHAQAETAPAAASAPAAPAASAPAAPVAASAVAAEAPVEHEPAAAVEDAEHGGQPADAHAAKAAHGDEHHADPAHGAAAHGDHHEHDPHHVIHGEILARKAGYFTPAFFYGRAVVYVLIWALLGWGYFKRSVAQDAAIKNKETGRKQIIELSKASYARSPGALAAFALSLTFAMFDWVMALEPSWFSTIYGIIMFATAVCSSLIVMTLITLSLREAGYLKGLVTTEHFHDLGKLLFGFTVFWAYVSFSQYMLIWYAGLPEETTFYHTRWDAGPWALVSIVVLLGHFVVPLFFFMSRNIKRNLPVFKVGLWLYLPFHFIEWYWQVMPNLLSGADEEHAFSASVLDVTTLLAVGGIYFALVFYQMTKHKLIPVGDPRLQRSIHFQNA